MSDFAVIGHFTPTDADIEDGPGKPGVLDEFVGCFLTSDRAEAENALIWYPDGQIVDLRPEQSDE